MGLFDSIANAVGGALGQTDKGAAAGNEGGAQDILGSLLQQGGLGQSGGIVGDLLGGLTGQGGHEGQSGGALGGVLQSLAAGGLAEQVSSWLANTPNLPISPEQLHDALGSEQVQQLAAQSGLPIGDFLKNLAEHLPKAASEAAGAPTGDQGPAA